MRKHTVKKFISENFKEKTFDQICNEAGVDYIPGNNRGKIGEEVICRLMGIPYNPNSRGRDFEEGDLKLVFIKRGVKDATKWVNFNPLSVSNIRTDFKKSGEPYWKFDNSILKDKCINAFFVAFDEDTGNFIDVFVLNPLKKDEIVGKFEQAFNKLKSNYNETDNSHIYDDNGIQLIQIKNYNSGRNFSVNGNWFNTYCIPLSSVDLGEIEVDYVEVRHKFSRDSRDINEVRSIMKRHNASNLGDEFFKDFENLLKKYID